MRTAPLSPANVKADDLLTGVLGPDNGPAVVIMVEPYSDSETTITYAIPGVPGYGSGSKSYEQTLTLDNDCRVLVGRR